MGKASEILCSLRNVFYRVEVKGGSQFTIDFKQGQLGIEEFYDPHKIKTFQDGKNYLGSLAYQSGCIIDIMKPDIPDIEYFKAIRFLAENLPLYEYEFEDTLIAHKDEV